MAASLRAAGSVGVELKGVFSLSDEWLALVLGVVHVCTVQ